MSSNHLTNCTFNETQIGDNNIMFVHRNTSLSETSWKEFENHIVSLINNGKLSHHQLDTTQTILSSVKERDEHKLSDFLRTHACDFLISTLSGIASTEIVHFLKNFK